MVWSKADKGEYISAIKRKQKAVDDHCKVVWVYNGLSEEIIEMYDKPRRLCYWWVREHKRDSQYCKGQFYVVSMYFDRVRTS